MFGRSRQVKQFDPMEHPEVIDALNVMCQRAYNEAVKDYRAFVADFISAEVLERGDNGERVNGMRDLLQAIDFKTAE